MFVRLKLFFIFLFFSFSIHVYALLSPEQVLLQVLFTSVFSAHVETKPINDHFSKNSYDLFLKWIDPQKRFFIAEDIEKFKQHELNIDNEIQVGSYAFFDLVHSSWILRTKYLEGVIFNYIDQDMDLFSPVILALNRDKRTEYCKDLPELKELWKSQIKYRLINNYLDLVDEQKDVTENHSIATLTDPIIIDPELLLEARAKVKSDYKQLFKNIRSETYEELRHLYLNALLGTFDSHTSYFPVEKKEDFDISISGQLEGIGAILNEKENVIEVDRIVPGGAAARQGELAANDKILKVAQGKNGPYVSVVGMRVRDAVKLIRGKKGTIVRLYVRKSSGKTLEIPIVRDVVVLEETFAKSVMIKDTKHNKAYGYIYLPKFYRDFDDNMGRNSSDDVRHLLEELRLKNVDAVVLDMRNNEGGALLDAVKLAGLFLKDSPIVQVKDKNERIQVYQDDDRSIVYAGPLLVLINHYSASAAEIVAAALQDHDRAVVVGSDSYGKGTVQTLADLKRLYPVSAKINPDLGAIKLTIQKFYRVNGSSTQIKGVSPDILLPDVSMYQDIGEKYMDSPLSWDQIGSVYYESYGNLPISYLQEMSNTRIKNSTWFESLNQYFTFLKQRKDEQQLTVSLPSLIQRRKDIDELENNKSSNEIVYEYLTFEPLTSSENNDWMKPLKKDPYLHEGLMILNDLMEYQK